MQRLVVVVVALLACASPRPVAIRNWPQDNNADVKAIDRKSSAVVAAAIAKHGWPGKSLVGADGSHAADYAYLYDRVALAEHRLQRYGTQWNGTEPRPLEDPANVDARRKAVGLGPMAEYRKQIEALHLPRVETGSGSDQ